MLANEIYICPFCAYKDKLIVFRIKTEKYTGKTFQCPDCHQIMRRDTLLRNVTPREWGIWLYASVRVWNKPGEKFYDRIKKNDDGSFTLSKRLYLMGEEIAGDFWGGWMDAKNMTMNQWRYIVDNAYIQGRKQTKLVDAKRRNTG
jgi:hypothetical protein